MSDTSLPVDDAHLSYLERLLDGAVRREGTNEFLYVTRTDGRPGFWELVGFRVPGLPRAVVGALHFHAQSSDPLVFARRSLGHFLSSPPQALGLERASYPADVIELRVPRDGQSLPELLSALKRGEPTASLSLDVELVELAFDFRPENPSLQRQTTGGGPTQQLLFRTRDGHVLRGTSTNLAAKLRRAGSFVALTEVAQLVPEGPGRPGSWMPLPTTVIRRSHLTMLTEPPPDGRQELLPAAFSPATARAVHLLDPRLGTGAPAGGA